MQDPAAGPWRARGRSVVRSRRFLDPLRSIWRVAGIGCIRLAMALSCLGHAVAQDFRETFDTDPISAGRFVQGTAETESRFEFDAGRGVLNAVLDVDHSPAYYLSKPITAVTGSSDASFSVEFTVNSADDQFTPTAFIGLVTETHVENGGDGLTLLLSMDAGRLTARANIDASTNRWAGGTIPLALGQGYLALGRFRGGTGGFVIEIYDGAGFTNLLGFSSASLPSGVDLRVDRLGLQNAGFEEFDRSVGSISLTVDNLFTPARMVHSVTLDDSRGVEGSVPGGKMEFSVHLAPASSESITVDYTTTDGTAHAGTDYEQVSGTLVFAPGGTVGTIRVPILNDALNEDNETFALSLTNASEAVLSRATAVGTIIDDDPLPNLSILDAVSPEGDPGGTNSLQFLVRLSEVSGRTVSFDFRTTSNTALEGVDFAGQSGTLSLPPGTLATNIVVPVLGDRTAELDETLFLDLSRPTNARMALTRATGTILDDDGLRGLTISDASVVEGGVGSTTNAVFEITLREAAREAIRVDYSVVNGTAQVGIDLLAHSGTLVIPPGVTHTNIAVTVIGDAMPEPDESFVLNLSNPVGVELVRTYAVGTILNDDPFPRLSITDLQAQEGDSGTMPAEFVVTLSSPTSVPVAVQVETRDGTAIAGLDYQSTAGTVTFPAGSVRQSFFVNIIGDTLSEANESFGVILSSPTNAVIERAYGLGTILDDDPLPKLSIADVTVTEPDSGTISAGFEVRLSAVAGRDVRVSFRTEDGTAMGGTDYTPMFGRISIPAGSRGSVVNVPVIGDLTYEGIESFSVALSDPDNADLVRWQAIGTILDNDEPPRISISDATANEKVGGSTASFWVSLSNPSHTQVAVSYATSGETATEGVDYIGRSGSLLFAPGQTRQEITVQILDDLVWEPAERFFLGLTNLVNALPYQMRGVGTILDNEPRPSLTVRDTEVLEGDNGLSTAEFVLTLSGRSSEAVTVLYATADGDAQAGIDYVSKSGALIIPPGELSATVQIPVIGDTLVEADESFFLTLSDARGASLAKSRATATIRDDDSRGILIDDVTVLEGKAGTSVAATFAISLSKGSPNPIRVDFRTGDGSASAGSDYLSTNGTVLFLPGETRHIVPVVVLGDDVPEPNEQFLVYLDNPQNATLLKVRGVGTIVDDDFKFKIAPGGQAVTSEACTPGNGAIDPFEKVTVELRLINSGNTPTPPISAALVATNGVHVFSSPQTYGVISPGQSPVARVFTMLVEGRCGDSLNLVLHLRSGTEDLRTVSFPTTLGRLVNGIAVCCSQADVGIAAIDKPDPVLAGGELTYEILVQNHGPSAAVGVTLSGSLDPGLRLQSWVVPQGTAIEDAGKVRVSIGTLAPDSSVRIVAMLEATLVGQAISTFVVETESDDPDRSNNVAAILTDVRAVSGLSIEDTSVVEGNGGTTNAIFAVHLSAPVAHTVTCEYVTIDGAAQAGVDYLQKTGTLTLPPGVTSTNVVVTVIGDLLQEGDEQFSVELRNPSGSDLAQGRSTGVCTILDDDRSCVSVEDASFRVPDGPDDVVIQVPIGISTPSARPVEVTCATGDGSGVAGELYVRHTGVVTITPGQTNGFFPIVVRGAGGGGGQGTLLVQLANSIGASLCHTQATLTVVREHPPTVAIRDVSVKEGNSGTTAAILALNLSAPSGVPVQVDYQTSSGTAQSGSDFNETHGTLTFPPGATQGSIEVLVYGDSEGEADEGFFVTLSNPKAATLGRSRGVVTIVNDDYGAIAVGGGSLLTSETCNPRNGAIDRGEVVTVDFSVVNRGFSATSNLVATLLPLDGVVPLSGPQPYGRVDPNGRAISRSFTFLVDRDCGQNFHATLGLADGSEHLPAIDFELFVGALVDGRVTCCESADVSVGLDVQPNPVLLGESLTLRITVTNLGPADASNVVLTNRLLAGMSFVSVTTRAGTTTGPGGTIVPVGPIPAGQSVDVLVKAKAEQIGSAIAGVVASGSEFDPNRTNNSATVVVSVVPPPGLSVGSITVKEGGLALVPIRLSPVAHAVSCLVSTADGTATAGNDYVALVPTRIVLPPGLTSTNVAIQTLEDTIDEPDEVFHVRLTDAVGASISVAEGGVTIQDNDPPCLSVADISVNVGLEGDTTAILEVTLSSPTDRFVSVTYGTSDGTATSGTDYVPTFGTLAFPPGAIRATLPIVISGNTQDEGIEHFFLHLHGPVGATLCASNAVVTITDESPGRIEISDARAVEGDGGTVSMPFQISLATPLRYGASVDFFSADGSAVAGEDYIPTSGTIRFEPGQTNASIVFAVIGDRVWEPDETLRLNLRNVQNAHLARDHATGTILNDDPLPVVRCDPVTLVEGDFGRRQVQLHPELSNPSSVPVVLAFRTRDGSARAGSDYVGAEGTVTIPPGSTRATVTVDVIGDMLDEPDETFYVDLTTGPTATLAGASVLATILDDDAVPMLSVPSIQRLEGNSGQIPVVFAVVLSAPSGKPVQVDYSTADGTALSGSDYVAVSGHLQFLEGETNKFITIQAIGDTRVEADETFRLIFSNAVNVDVSSVRAVGTLLNDDDYSPPAVSIIEPTDGSRWPDHISLSILATANDSDGAVSQVRILADGSPLGVVSSEPYRLLWTNPPTGDHRLTAVATDNDGLSSTSAPVQITILPPTVLPQLRITDAQVSEGDEGRASAIFGLSLDHASGSTVSVDVATSDLTATAGMDYLPVKVRVQFPPGSTQQSVSVEVIGDRLVEPDETFRMILANPDSATIARPEAIGTILNDDGNGNQLPVVAILSPADRSSFPPYASIQIEVAAHDSDGHVAAVELFSGSTRLTRWTEPPYRFTWETVPVGTYILTATAVDDQGALGQANPVRVVVSDLAGDVAIVRNAPDVEIDVMEDYIFDMGLSPWVFDQEGLTFEALRRFRLVVWDDLGRPGLANSTVDILQRVYDAGIPLYFMGEKLGSARNDLSSVMRLTWEWLTHTSYGGPRQANAGLISVRRSVEPHCILNGRFGQIVDFAYSGSLESLVPSPEAEVYGGAEDAALLVGFPEYVGADLNPEVVRTYSQGSRLTTAGGLLSIQERKELFQNVVAWLLKLCNPCSTLSLRLEIIPPEGPLAIGQSATFLMRLHQTGECEATEVVVTNSLPANAQFVSAASPRGRVEARDGLVRFSLGHLASADTAEVSLTLVPTEGCEMVLAGAVRSLNARFDPEIAVSSTTNVISGGPKLRISQGEDGRGIVSIHRCSPSPLQIQTSRDLVHWTIYTNLPAGTVGTMTSIPIPISTQYQFLRAVMP